MMSFSIYLWSALNGAYFVAANTNASLINDKNIEKILKDGPKYLVVSLDSHIEKYHSIPEV